jgi:microcystin-dependent protein
MPTLTPRLGIPKPLASEPPNGPAQIGAVADALDNAAIDLPEGLLSARPAPSIRGRWYYATDVGLLYRDSGSTWRVISVGPDAITATEIAPDAVGNSELAPNAVTNTEVAAAAAIAESKLSLATDAVAGTGSRRTLGAGALQACAGNDARLSDQRVPTNGSVSFAKLEAAIQQAIWGVGGVKAVAYAVTAGSEEAGWLLCDGRAVSRTGANAALFAKLGTVHGPGDGSSTFNLPDYRGRPLVGVGTHVDVNAVGKTDAVSLSSRTPRHSHTVNAHSHVVNAHSHQHVSPIGVAPGTVAYINPADAILDVAGDYFFDATLFNVGRYLEGQPIFNGDLDRYRVNSSQVSPGTNNASPGTDTQGTYNTVHFLIKL